MQCRERGTAHAWPWLGCCHHARRAANAERSAPDNRRMLRVNVLCNYTIEVEEEEHGSSTSSDGSRGSLHYASDTGSAYSSQLVRAS